MTLFEFLGCLGMLGGVGMGVSLGWPHGLLGVIGGAIFGALLGWILGVSIGYVLIFFDSPQSSAVSAATKEETACESNPCGGSDG